MNRLISMTDFVLKTVQTPNINEAICWEQTQNRLDKIYHYSLFLKQPLKLEMFVPCDDEGNVLEFPKFYNRKDKKPKYGKQVYFRYEDQSNEELTDGTFEEYTKCILGGCPENFQDNYNKLTCDAQIWVDGDEWDIYQQAKEKVLFEGFKIEHSGSCLVLIYPDDDFRMFKVFDDAFNRVTIESCVGKNLTLTESAKKQIGI